MTTTYSEKRYGLVFHHTGDDTWTEFKFHIESCLSWHSASVCDYVMPRGAAISEDDFLDALVAEKMIAGDTAAARKAAARQRWANINASIYSWVRDCQSTKHAMLVLRDVPRSDGKKAVETLLARYDKSSSSSIHHAMVALLNIQHTAGMDIDDFAILIEDKVASIIADLAKHKYDMWDLLRSTVFLRNSTSELEQTKTIIQTQTTLMPYADIKRLLKDAYARLAMGVSTFSSSSSTAYSVAKLPAAASSVAAVTHECIHCHGRHLSDECFTKFPELRLAFNRRRDAKRLEQRRQRLPTTDRRNANKASSSQAHQPYDSDDYEDSDVIAMPPSHKQGQQRRVAWCATLVTDHSTSSSSKIGSPTTSSGHQTGPTVHHTGAASYAPRFPAALRAPPGSTLSQLRSVDRMTYAARLARKVETAIPAQRSTQTLHASAATASDPNTISLAIDTGSSHIFLTSEKGVTVTDRNTDSEVICANGAATPTTAVGYVPHQDGTVKLPDVNIVPGFTQNLLGIHPLYEKGMTLVISKKYGINLYDDQDAHQATGYVENKQFMLDVTIPSAPPPKAQSNHAVSSPSPNYIRLPYDLSPELVERCRLWYRRLAATGVRASYQTIKDSDGHDLPADLTYQQWHWSVSNNAIHMATRVKAPAHRNLHRRELRRRGNFKAAPFRRFHMDIRTESATATDGSQYYCNLVDDFSGIIHPITLKTRTTTELVAGIESYLATLPFEVDLSAVTAPKHLRPKLEFRGDNGGEQKSTAFTDFLRRHKAIIQYTDPYSSASNGVAERSIQTLDTHAKAIRLLSDTSARNWPHHVRMAAKIHSLLSNSTNPDSKSPQAMLEPTRRQNIGFLRVPGSTVILRNLPRKNSDLPGVFGKLLSYTPDGSYVVGLPNGATKILRSASFIEKLSDGSEYATTFEAPPALAKLMQGPTIQPLQKALPPAAPVSPSPPLPPHSVAWLNQDDDPTEGEDTVLHVHHNIPEDAAVRQHLEDRELIVDLDPPSRYPQRSHKPAARLIAQQASSRPSPPIIQASPMRAFRAEMVPRGTAQQDPRVIAAKTTYMDTLLSLNNPSKARVEIVPISALPADATVLRSIPITAHKYDEHNVHVRTKHRLAPDGSGQVANRDYYPHEVSYPVISMTSDSIFNHIVVHRKMHVMQLDVDAAFGTQALRAPRPIYIRWNHGYNQYVPNTVLRLVNALEGLKQSGYIFYRKVRTLLESLGFSICQTEPALFFKWTASSTQGRQLILVGVSTDDFRIAADDKAAQSALLEAISEAFDGAVKIMPMTHYNGIALSYDRDARTMKLNMDHFVTILLENMGMTQCHPVATPSAPGTKLHAATDTDEIDKSIHLRSLLGSLRWIARTVHWEIEYALSQLVPHVNAPTPAVVTAAKRILRYLKGRLGKPVVITSSSPSSAPLPISCYSDSDYNGEPIENPSGHRSLSACIILVEGGGPVFASTTFQKTTAASTYEAESRSFASTMRNGMICRNIMDNIQLPLRTIPIYEDNAACIQSMLSPVVANKARHIKTDHCTIRDYVRTGDFRIIYCPTDEMRADMLNKAVPTEVFVKHRDAVNLGIRGPTGS